MPQFSAPGPALTAEREVAGSISSIRGSYRTLLHVVVTKFNICRFKMAEVTKGDVCVVTLN